MNKLDPNTGKVISNPVEDTRIDTPKDEVVRTQQSAKDECDLNLIVENARRGAGLPVSGRTPMYGDFTGLPDYKQACLMVSKAQEMFMSLDAFVRERFGNDPGRLLDFLADGKNREEAIKLGLVKAPDVPVPDEHLSTLKSIDSSLKAHSDAKSKKPKGDGD